MIRIIFIVLSNMCYVHSIDLLKTPKKQLRRIEKSFLERGHVVKSTHFKQETIYFKIVNSKGKNRIAECKPIELLDFDCIYKRIRSFKSRLEFFATLKTLNHHNQLKIFDVYECSRHLIIIREFFENGIAIKDSEIVRKNKMNKEKLLIGLLKPIFYILDYFLYLRHRCLYHGNITTENILINEKGEVKIYGLFSIKRSYFCEMRGKKAISSFHMSYTSQSSDHGEDVDIKKLFELIIDLSGLTNTNIKSIDERLSIVIKKIKNKNLIRFLKALKDSIGISENRLIELRNHVVFDDIFGYHIYDFRELDNFVRIENYILIQKTDKNKLIYHLINDGNCFIYHIEIKSTYTTDVSLANKVYRPFLEISCYDTNQMPVLGDLDDSLDKISKHISSHLMTLKDTNSYIIIKHLNTTIVYYDKFNDTTTYITKNCIIVMKDNAFYYLDSNKHLKSDSPSIEAIYPHKLFLILLKLFKSIKYNQEESKLECDKYFEKFIRNQEELLFDRTFLQYKQFALKLTLPHIYIDEIGSIEIDDDNYVYNLEKEPDNEIYESKGIFYKIDVKTMEFKVIELTESQKYKIEILRNLILIDADVSIGFADQFN